MSLSKQLFRESALERLSSPEQLDRLLRITSPKGWIALLAIWALLGAVIVWSILGEVPTKEEGRGILVSGSGLRLASAGGAGRLSSIVVEVNQRVQVNEVIALIDQQNLQAQLQESESKLLSFGEQRAILDELDREEALTEQELANEEREQLAQVIAFAENRVERNEGLFARIAAQVDKGMMPAIDLERAQEAIDQAHEDVEQARVKLQEINTRLSTTEAERARARTQRALDERELARAADLLRDRLEREANVRSPVAGRVVEIRAALYTKVEIGDPILLIEPDESSAGDLEAILYVSAETGKLIDPGDEVSIVPSTVKQEEYGSMKGLVRMRADMPTSRSAMMAQLNDAELVESFIREIGLPLEMRVELIRDPDTRSGYEWTSSQGPPTLVSAGTLCEGSVTVEERRPIHLVIPKMRSADHDG